MAVEDWARNPDRLMVELRGRRRRAEASVADVNGASEVCRLFRRVIGGLPVVVFAIDGAGVLTLVEGKGKTWLGANAGAYVGRELSSLCSKLPGVEEAVVRALAGETGSVCFEVGVTSLEVSYAPLHNEAGAVIGAAGMAVDVTEREQELGRLRSGGRLMERMLDLNERDRRLTACEIHDGMLQDAVGAQMQLGSLLEEPTLSEDVRRQVRRAVDLVGGAIAQGRELIGGLRPPVLDALGVVPAIEVLAEGRPGEGPLVDFSADVEFDRLPPLLETTIYRIAQEAITNVRRHSRSDRSEIRLTQADGWIRLEIEDWGVGFDPTAVNEDRFGLRGIRERARLLRGRAAIRSAKGKGTRIVADLPLSPALEEIVSADSWS